ncbi:MAG: type 2 isopentenyl-diphosphate Delta-isomerase, partial [Alkalispirochaeta sp.]
QMTAHEEQRDHHSGPELSRRKSQHLSICLDAAAYKVETSETRFSEVHLLHRALPEINAADVDTSTVFLGSSIAMPVFISSMTGGSEGAYQVNKDLAAAAQELGIPVGMGSIRILFRKPDVIEHFLLKRYAPNVPVFANIGGVQLPELAHDEIYRMIERLEVDAIAVHLNPGQELAQPGGDVNFAGIFDEIRRFAAGSPVPVIVKETGFGIDPATVVRLLEGGATYVDIAGAGGTNWNRVESYRHEDPAIGAAVQEFDDWGIPTALILGALGRNRRGVLASGGIRSGMDVLKAVALGAEAAGLALPFVRAVTDGGVPAAVAAGRQLQYVIRTGMALTGCTVLSGLREAPIWTDESFRLDSSAIRRAAGSNEEYDG